MSQIIIIDRAGAEHPVDAQAGLSVGLRVAIAPED